jgi:hypothetical protein
MAQLGGASFAWVSDYGQFYLIDADDPQFHAPTVTTDEMQRRRWHPMASGLVVYTNDCLQQNIEVRVHDVEPPLDATEWRSKNTWTQVERASAEFPSKRFTLSSPSHPDTHTAGPFFRIRTSKVAIRIAWMEFQGSRDDSVPVQPDVIRLDLWPA